jgi:ribosomal protein S18 acetylase RimI-like enzyme
LNVRPTTQADVAPILQIVEQGGVFNAEESDAVRDLLDYYFRKPDQDEYLWLTAEDGGRVLGFACYGRIALTQRNYELNWIATDRNALRGGVGSALLRAVEDTSATGPYAAARAFYERHGYHVVARIPDYYADGDDLLMYRKRLA